MPHSFLHTELRGRGGGVTYRNLGVEDCGDLGGFICWRSTQLIAEAVHLAASRPHLWPQEVWNGRFITVVL